MQNNFIHLRVQSSYSMLESALKVEKIIQLAKAQDMPAVCVADRGNLFGSLEFAQAACKSGVQPINGSILNIEIPHITSDKNFTQQFGEILLIAKDDIGYLNLLKLVSYSFTKNDRKICNHITFADLTNHSEGLIVLSAYSDGMIGKLLLAKDYESAAQIAQKLQSLLGDRFYFEIMRHNYEHEISIERQYINIAAEYNIPLVATNKVLFSDIDMSEAHDVLLCIAAGATREDQQRRRVSNQCYFKTPQEMIELFSDLPGAIENTLNIALRCSVMSEPRPPMLPNFASQDQSEEGLLRAETNSGLLSKLEAKFAYEQTPENLQAEIKQKYFERLEYELDIICRMNFSGYFLIVSDFIKWSKEQNISVGPGRGSGAGSMVAWCLLITDLDPLKFGLLFERFLNPERISMPDFDIDFCQERREEVINYVRSKYGDSRVGQIITFGKLQAKAVIKDVSRVLGLAYRYADYLTELVPFNAITPVTLSQAIEEVAELSQAAKGKGLYDLLGEEELIKQVISTALILEGLHRHASTHAAGIVIAGKELVELVPIYRDIDSNMLIVQYSMKYADLAGLMKFDFLGLQTLTVIRRCQDLLKAKGIEVSFNNILFDDPKTYEMLAKGLGTGVFQFESIGMKDTLRRLKPDCIEDLIALGALYRPGPMENIPTYIACKHKRQQPDYLHPLLRPLLEETYGVIIYQEQVLEIAKILAKYTLGAADLLRRAMGKKIKSEMAAQEELFIQGARANGIATNQAKSIFATVAKFAGYGFNKAHASAYGAISYQTAYLKANFPAEFLSVCLNLEMDNSDKINLFIQEARNLKIGIVAPDINLSSNTFSISEADGHKSLIYAFGAIKNVTSNFGIVVVEERARRGQFKNIIDFVERIPSKFINKRLVENLIKAGCFDKIHSNRNQLLQSVPKLIAYSVSHHQEENSSQFSLIKVNSLAEQILIEAPELKFSELAFDQFDVLGLFITNHPLDEYKDLLNKLNVCNSNYLFNELASGSHQIKIAGIIQRKDARMSARGRFITLQLSDQCGIFDLTIFSEEILKNYVHLLNIRTSVIASCEVFKDEGGIRITAKSFATLDDLIKNNELNVRIIAQNDLELKQILKLLHKSINNEKANLNVILLVAIENHFLAKIDLAEQFYLTNEDLIALKPFTKF